MSISFSGLASGLDTSSWVESLTALKRAKVETYKAEKENILATQKTLSSIKSFFNSFRSVIEKVTDSRFGTGSLDLFSQSLAVSSKADVLTATAGTSAKEGIYNINVNNIATNTQASSGYSSITSRTVSSTATSDSTMKSIGVKSGRIGIKVDGVERIIRIANDETIESFNQKLNNIGVQSSYNETTGRFNLKLSPSKIRDIDSTGIVDALHLQGVNEGYKSSGLEAVLPERIVTNAATLSTTLSQLGVDSGYIKIGKNDSGASEVLNINKNWTINEFVNSLKSSGYDADFIDGGRITLSGASIDDDGSTGLLRAFGWDRPIVTATEQTSKVLQYNTTAVEGSIADRNTRLKDIGYGTTVNDGDTIIARNSSNETSTITLQASSTIGDVLDGLRNAGINTNMGSGIISITDGTIIGGTFDIKSVFSLNETLTGSSAISNALYVKKTVPVNMTSTGPVTFTSETTARLSDKVMDFNTNGWDGLIMVQTYNEEHHGYDSSIITVTSDMTFADLFNKLESYDINASLRNGVISLTSPSKSFIDGDSDFYEIFNFSVTPTETIHYTQTYGATLTTDTLWWTDEIYATGSSPIADYITLNTTCSINIDGATFSSVNAAVGIITDGDGTNHTIYAGREMTSGYNLTDTNADYVRTFDELISLLSTYGINASLSDGKLHLEGRYTACDVSGNLFDQLGIDNLHLGTKTTGADKTGTKLMISTDTLNISQTRYITVAQKRSNGSAMLSEITILTTDTVDDIITKLAEKGISATLKIPTRTTLLSTTTPATPSRSAMPAATPMASGLGGSSLGPIGSGTLGPIETTPGFSLAYFHIDASDTSYITGMDSELKTALGLGGATDLLYTTSSVYQAYSSNLYTPESKQVANDTLLSLVPNIPDNCSISITKDFEDGTLGTSFITINDDTTFSDFQTMLANLGITATLRNGKITFKNGTDSYISDFGGFAGLSGPLTKAQTTYKYRNGSSTRIEDAAPRTRTIGWDTTLGDLGGAEGHLSIQSPIEPLKVDYNTNTTMSELRDKLAEKGIFFNITDGIVSIENAGSTYIYNDSAGLLSKLGISSGPMTTTLQSLTSDDGLTKLYELYYADGSAAMNFDSTPTSMPTPTYPPGSEPTSTPDPPEPSHTPGVSDDCGFYIYKDGTSTPIIYNNYTTLNSFLEEIRAQGINVTITEDGRLKFSGSGEIYFSPDSTTASTVSLNDLGLTQDNWTTVSAYNSSEVLKVNTASTSTIAADRNTNLADLGVTTGEYYLYKDGVKNTLYVSSGDTLGDFINTLRTFGIEAGINTEGSSTTLKLHGNGDAYIAASSNSGSSNIVTKLFETSTPVKTYDYSGAPTYETSSTEYGIPTEDTFIKDLRDAPLMDERGTFEVKINDNVFNIEVNQNETIGNFLDKLRSLGVEASMSDGEILIQSGFDTLQFGDLYSYHTLRCLNLNYQSDMGGYSSTAPDSPIISKEVIVEENHNSAANYADYSTKLDLLNISGGTLTLYRDGEKATIEIDKDQDFNDLNSKIAAKFSDAQLVFDNGYLKITSSSGDIAVGADTSNFTAITGLATNEDGDAISSRALYRVNNDSKITTSGLFAMGDVTEGDFKVGNAVIHIDNNTTLNDIISQINYSEDSNATAFWDSIDGKFVIKSKSTGASLINIEAGSSNFTDIMGLTKTQDGVNKMVTTAQELGKNAVFTINGARFTSTTNTISSDISRIEGVTLNLKDASNGETITLSIEKDKENAANAVSDVVDAYNELITNIDKEAARTGNLKGESTLRLLRNQIRSLMTGSIGGSGVYKNLSSIGVSLAAATSGNIRTDNINELSFDKDKFMNAFSGDTDALKTLLVGTNENKGILSRVEDVLEQALGGVTGYFASAEKSYTNKISKLDAKINSANKAADRYKVRLEAKFKAMDMLISKFQNQYSSFLGS